MISLDCGANTHFVARHMELKPGQTLTSPGMMATMAPGPPFAIAAKLAYPGRQSVAVVGDGGFAMLMAELATAVQQNLPIKVLLLKNNALAEVFFEQKEIGNPTYGCELQPIDSSSSRRPAGRRTTAWRALPRRRAPSRRPYARRNRRSSRRSSTRTSSRSTGRVPSVSKRAARDANAEVCSWRGSVVWSHAIRLRSAL